MNKIKFLQLFFAVVFLLMFAVFIYSVREVHFSKASNTMDYAWIFIYALAGMLIAAFGMNTSFYRKRFSV